MKIWIDDVRAAPDGYAWYKSANEAISGIEWMERMKERITVIDIDHDAGDYACDGGDYVKLLDWLEETGRNYPIRIHSMNPVGVQNMRNIIEKNGWTEIR